MFVLTIFVTQKKEAVDFSIKNVGSFLSKTIAIEVY